MNSTIQAETPRLTLVASTAQSLRQPTESVAPLQFLQAISASLELDQALHTLTGFLHDLVGHSGWEYRHTEFALEWSGGKPDRHRLEYVLTRNGQALGTLILMRSRRFSDADQLQIEELLGLAAPALHHALRFHALSQQLERDPLTGLGNRRALNLQGAQWLADSVRHRQPVSMLAIDLDRFKSVNDRFGHPTGDRVLCRLAEILRAQTRASDLCVRLGGDEFVVLLPRTKLSDALECAERIRRAIAQIALVPAVGEPDGITVSIGVATASEASASEAASHRASAAFHSDLAEAMACAERMRQVVSRLALALPPGDPLAAPSARGAAEARFAIDLDLLYRQADSALYAAKRAGCDRVLTSADAPNDRRAVGACDDYAVGHCATVTKPSRHIDLQ